MSRDRIMIAVELSSAACLVVGASLVATAAGWLTAGGLGLLVAWRAS